MAGKRSRGAWCVLSLLFVVSLASCGDPGLQAPIAITSGDGGFVMPMEPPPVVSPCVDRDGDGFGEACVAGPDCDDDNPAVTRECRACLRPDTGCPCVDGAPAVPCNLATGTTEEGPEGVCHLGQRSCRQGAWSACETLESAARIIGVVSTCYGACDPSCQHVVDCVEPGDALPAGTSLATVSSIDPAVFCPTGTRSGGVQPQCENRPGGAYTRAVSPATWVNACTATGATVLLANADEGTATVALPFSFAYWGIPYRSVNITPNGVMQFSTATSSIWVNTTLPASTIPNAIFPFWDDLMVRASGICVATVGSGTDRRTVIEWADAAFYPTYDATVHLTFEVILNERTQTIDVLYNTMAGPDARATGNSATIGLQEGSGTRFDLVGYNTGGVATTGAGFRWTPATNDLYCQAATYHRVFEATCPSSTVPVATIPTWGRLNYTALVPLGAAIRMELRAANTLAALATATPVRLPDAPRTSGNVPVPGAFDVGDLLQNTMRGLAHVRYLDLTARFDPGPDQNLVPVLGSMEVQFHCVPVEDPYRCTPGGACRTAGVCRRGVVACPQQRNPVCVDAGPLPAGTSCGIGLVCNSVGACVTCNEGASCNTGNTCTYGRISCATGSPVCTPFANRPLGSVCSFGAGNYTRTTSPLGYVDVCSAPGAVVYLPTDQDSVTLLTMPFGFRMYGTVYTGVGVGVNGLMTFPTGATAWVNTALPAAGIGDAIMPFWDDLQTRPTGICSGTVGTAPTRIFGVQWANVDLQDRGFTGNLGASLNFEVLLEESSQAINVLYGDMVGDARATGSGATIGIQKGDGTLFSLVGYNTANTVLPNSSIRWVPPIASTCDGAGACVACATAEVCDGRDNNCNGLIDEGIPDITCGVGACMRSVPACVRGVTQTCTAGTATTELCDGIDNDCNAVVDDGCGGNLTCPGRITVHAGNAQVMSVVPRGFLTGYQWEIVTGPPGGGAGIVWDDPPPHNPTTRAVPYIVGTYRIRVTAYDRSGALQACDFELVVVSHGLRVELTWDGTGDLDLHLHNNVSGAWFNNPNDCFYANMRPAWGAALDVDNVTANGPENIRMDTPTTGRTYSVAIHNYARGEGRTARVRIFCGTVEGTIPQAEYFSVPLAGTQSGNCTGNTFWKVANITINADGSCVVVPVNTYTSSSSACSTR